MIAQYINWNPGDVIVSLGSFELRWYSLCFALAFYLGYTIVKGIFKKEQVDDKVLDKLLVYTVVATVLGARLGHVIFYEGFSYIFTHPVETFLPFSFNPEFHFTGFRGLASHGGAMAILIALYIFSKKVTKKPYMWIMDRVAPSIALASVFIRTGNLMNSEIIGHPTDMPWAFIFERVDMSPRHPAQLYEAIAYLIVFFMLRNGYKNKGWLKQEGKLFSVMVIGIFVSRFVIEFFKKSQGGFEESLGLLTTGQWLSIPFVLFGIYFLNKGKKAEH